MTWPEAAVAISENLYWCVGVYAMAAIVSSLITASAMRKGR